MEATGAQGAAGPQGETEGQQGQQARNALSGHRVRRGLPGTSSNIFPSAQAYTLPKNGQLIVTDAHVMVNSVIVLQYVGGDKESPVALEILNGRFSVKGQPNRKFRYVVFN